MEKDYIYKTEIEVRDYECDIEGIVNNANYLHYTEHTRHRFLKSLGLSFAKLHEQGTDAVVARMQLQFKTPLQCDDIIVSCMNIRKEGMRFVFLHDLYRKRDMRLCFHADVDLVTLVNGRLAISKDYDEAFAPFI
jgi:acyl-CoA thioester hydrolase